MCANRFLQRPSNHILVQAVKDWGGMKTFARLGEDLDPFLVTSGRRFGGAVLYRLISQWRGKASGQSRSEFDVDFPHFSTMPLPGERDGPSPIGGSVADRLRHPLQLMKKAGRGLIGGLSFIGPMLVMVLHKSILTTLLTASICVSIFGLILAIMMDDPVGVLSGTAAYAAVLVVFVGASGGGS
jgi:hypothetical protein